MNLVILLTELNNSFFPYSIVLQFHSLFQSLFSTVILFNEVKNSFAPFRPTVVPLSLPKPVLHRLRFSFSSSSFQNSLISLRSSSSCLRLLPLLPVTSILPSTFLSLMCFRKQFLRKMWPVHLAFLLITVCRIFLSFVTLCNNSLLLKRSARLISLLPQHHITNLPMYFLSTLRIVQVSAPYKAMFQVQHCTSSFFKFNSKILLLVECWFRNSNSGFNFTCTSHIVCYHATKIFEIFHILHTGNDCVEITITLDCYPHP